MLVYRRVTIENRTNHRTQRPIWHPWHRLISPEAPRHAKLTLTFGLCQTNDLHASAEHGMICDGIWINWAKKSWHIWHIKKTTNPAPEVLQSARSLVRDRPTSSAEAWYLGSSLQRKRWDTWVHQRGGTHFGTPWEKNLHSNHSSRASTGACCVPCYRIRIVQSQLI